MGTTPARLMRPMVGLMPTTEFHPQGQRIEPSVPSIPSVTAAKFAATAMADPLLDPQGPADRLYGFCKFKLVTYN